MKRQKGEKVFTYRGLGGGGLLGGAGVGRACLSASCNCSLGEKER